MLSKEKTIEIVKKNIKLVFTANINVNIKRNEGKQSGLEL